jgi:hypothetical protein
VSHAILDVVVDDEVEFLVGEAIGVDRGIVFFRAV